ncbi:hypothetical protein ACFONC_12235 [Luteimonas soli]|uniref:Lipoprotein n=1 Tax=Luteimonas soli TaxID=1648966 RepID=A0ABV7XMH8_9GAMM
MSVFDRHASNRHASNRHESMRSGLLAAMLCALAACGSDAGSETRQAVAGTAAPSSAAGTTAAASARNDRDGAYSEARPGDAGVTGTQLLSHPDDLQVVMLGYRLRGLAPPLAQWAEGQQAVRRANEFERATVLQGERERLQSIYDGTADVGRLRLNVNSQFSEYDGSRGGYYLTAFSPGSVFTFSAQPVPGAREQVRVQVDNEEELNFWPLDAVAAQDVLREAGGTRSVTLDSSFRITGVSQRSDGTTITVRLQRYAIVADRYRNPVVLGERMFDEEGSRR